MRIYFAGNGGLERERDLIKRNCHRLFSFQFLSGNKFECDMRKMYDFFLEFGGKRGKGGGRDEFLYKSC